MNFTRVNIFLIVILMLLSACDDYNKSLSKDNNTIMTDSKIRPKAKKIPYEFEMHGVQLSDEYSWMRDPAWPTKVDNKEIISHLESENKHVDSFFDELKGQQEEFFNELKGRIKLADKSIPVKKDEYYYYTRIEEETDYSIYCRKYGLNGKEEILLDVNKLAEGKNFISLGTFSISSDNNMMAYSVDFDGSEKYTINIYDLKNKKYLSDKISDSVGSVIWHEDGSGFFYLPVNEKLRHDTVKFHKLGTNPSNDITIFHETNPLYSVGISKSSSKKYVFINVNGHDSNSIYFVDMNDASINSKLIDKRKDGILYNIDHDGDFFYKATNDGAKNFHILRSLQEESFKWSVYIQEEENYLSSFDITKNFLILNYKENGLAKIIVKKISSGEEKTVKFTDEAYKASCYSTNFKEDDIRITYSSLSRPNTTYNYDFPRDSLEILKIQEIPSGLKPEDYHVERIFAKSNDVLVPISLVYKKSLFKKNGSSPLFLYGYGSYGISIPPSFSNFAISLIERGFVYAIAHIRGGDDLGYEWYESAKFLTKKRTFDDFISVAHHLIDQKYTSKGNIVIMGGSAGGMLVGNVINNEPDLFKAAIAHVPFVDVLNTMLDEDLPLTIGEYKEWGNPKDKEYFEYIKSYCPYSNVSSKNYPHLFVTAGLSDPRVGYWEAAKWIANIAYNRTNNNLLLFKTNMEFGHSGASGRFDYLKDLSLDLVFISHLFNK